MLPPGDMPPPPPGGMPTSMLDGLRPLPSPLRPRRPRIPVLPVLACVLLVVAAVAIFTLHGGGHGTAATANTPTAAATASSSSPAARRQAAVALAGLLAQSVTDRASVIQAVTDVRSCGMSLGQDVRTFTGAANSRQALLSRLGSMPGRPLLSATMIQDLTSAWQASAQADRDLARWARDEASHRCTPRKSGSDANLQASYGPDSQATTGKQAFTRLWNPVASRYGLTNYQWDQL